MPAKVKVKVLAGRNLPVMDRASDTTDAFVEIKFGGVTHKTDVCRKSLNPHWNSTEWYRFEVEDSELQDEPLQLRVMDHDTYSANDAIGKVVVSLSPLLAREPGNTGGAVMSGWVPVYDTLHGIRGELNIIVKVELFSDFNKFRQSSCGVQFFHCTRVPPDYKVTAIHGFVDELIVNDDPEYQWIDKIRTPRASNEARQVAFIKLSNQVQRRVGLKASELGANAVIGYSQSFDLEGETGVVARATGTAVTLKHRKKLPPHALSHALEETNGTSPRDFDSNFDGYTPPVTIHNRRTSEPELSTTPKASSLPTTNQNSGGGSILKPSMNANNLEMLEYPFLTMKEFPVGFIVHLGGTVCARSVKLVDGGEAGSRAAWWAELRTELRAHARALRCSAVLGYTEQATICEDVCVLSASGTAAVINLDPSVLAAADEDIEDESDQLRRDSFGSDGVAKDCSLVHVPYSASSMPYRAELATCLSCGRGRVPAVLVATIEPPLSIPYTGKSCLVSASALRVRRAPAAAPEPAARDISDQLPFLEYELHRLLVAKLRMQGANALFGLRITVAIGERSVVALAAGTAVYITALPTPSEPTLKGQDGQVEGCDLRKALRDALTANRTRNGYDIIVRKTKIDEFDDAASPALDLCGDKDACVLELDEAEDQDTARALASQPSLTCLATTARLNGCKLAKSPPLYFMQIWRGRCGSGGGGPGGAASRALAAARYKLRRINPSALAGLRFHVDLPEDGGALDELQLSVSGVALPLESSNNDEVFRLDDESAAGVANGVVVTPLPGVTGAREWQGVCALRLLFVRESTAIREAGGLSGFMHNFLTEVMAVIRSHTAALGGNVLASCTIDELMLQDNPHKNQAQCLLSVGGDVIHVSY